MTVHDAPLSRSATLREAATLLGVSVTTLRRRIVAGQIRAERVERPQGSTWRVFVDGVQPGHAPADGATLHAPAETAAGHPGDQPADPSTATGYAELVVLVRDLTEQLAERSAVAALWQERAGVLAERLAVAETRMAALEAPHSPVASNLTPEGPDPSPGPPGPFSWPLPPRPSVRALAPWLVVAVILLAAGMVGWWPAWRW